MSAGKSLAVMMALALTACGGFPTIHPNAAKNNPANYKEDIQDCAQSYPETPDGVYLKRRIECMKLKGWQ
jgi:predicted small lipoprotein YifL